MMTIISEVMWKAFGNFHLETLEHLIFVITMIITKNLKKTLKYQNYSLKKIIEIILWKFITLQILKESFIFICLII